VKKEWRKLAWKIPWIARGIFYFLLSIGALVGLTALSIWIFRWAPEAYRVIDKYELLRDTLTIVLALLALGIAAFGTGAYLMLRQQVKRDAAERSRAEAERALAASINNQGFYLFWRQYKRLKDAGNPERFFLDLAIEVTKEAWFGYGIYLDDKERDVEEIICIIKNNLAYYVAEKKATWQPVSDEDRKLAQEFANYIETRITKHPAHAEQWVETIDFVNRHLPSRHRERSSRT